MMWRTHCFGAAFAADAGVPAAGVFDCEVSVLRMPGCKV
jgi:hypothetical protein